MTQRSTGQSLLLVLGALCCTAGFLGWVSFGWKAFTSIDDVTAKNDLGGQMMRWGVSGTVLMVLGMVFLHVAQVESEKDESETA